jgi:hypothetical protein
VCHLRTVRDRPMPSPCALRVEAFLSRMTERAQEIAIRTQALTAVDIFA